jgi:hypothetical protein
MINRQNFLQGSGSFAGLRRSRQNVHNVALSVPVASCSLFIVGAAIGAKNRSPVPWTGAPCSPQRTWAEKMGRSPFRRSCWTGERTAATRRALVNGVKALEEIRFSAHVR